MRSAAIGTTRFALLQNASAVKTCCSKYERVSTRQQKMPYTIQTRSQTAPGPLKYAAASVRRPVCPAYAQAPKWMWIVHGKNSIVPTVSPVSVIACAHWPIRKLMRPRLAPQQSARR